MFSCDRLKILYFVAALTVVSTQRNSNDLNIEDSTPSIPECNTTEPIKPDFSAPGRRISETKCYEYIWDMKNRVDQEERRSICRGRRYCRPGTRCLVAGGHETLPGEFTHMGAIGWKTPTDSWVFKCGSTLISPKFALTAAHCTKVSPRDTSVTDVEPKIIRFGAKNIYLETNRIDANISRIIIHPNYRSPKKYFDIAIIELENDVLFSKKVKPACLWTKSDDSFGGYATVTGWGISKSGTRNTSAELLVGEVDIVNSTTCKRLLRSSTNRHWKGINDNQLCAGKLEGGVDACQGDSGGPLQVDIPLPMTYIFKEGSMYYVIGVTSFGVGCAYRNLPGVYTRVSSFVDWIENIVWINN